MKKFLLIIFLIIIGVVAYNLNFGEKKEPPEAVIVETSNNDDEVPVASTRELLIGKWQSLSDASFTREFENDGTALDTYSAGDASDQEILSWSLFNSSNPEAGFTGEVEAGATYLSISNGRDSLFFKISKVTEAEMELIYMDRGGALNFKKVR